MNTGRAVPNGRGGGGMLGGEGGEGVEGLGGGAVAAPVIRQSDYNTLISVMSAPAWK